MSFSGRQFWLGDDYVSETMDFEEMLLTESPAAFDVLSPATGLIAWVLSLPNCLTSSQD